MRRNGSLHTGPFYKLFHSLFATLRAMAVIGLGERAEAAQLIADLAPAAGMLAGLPSGRPGQ